jgi:hypothetical protein
LLQRRARLDAELLDQRPAGRPVGGQCFCLPAAAVQSDHQLLVQSFAQRMGSNERLKLADDIRVAAEGQISFNPVLGRANPQFLQARDLHLREWLAAEIGQGPAAPQRQRRAKIRSRPAGGVCRQRLSSLFDQAFKTVHVELLVRDPEKEGMHLAGSTPSGLPQPTPAPCAAARCRPQGCAGRPLADVRPTTHDQNVAGDSLIGPEKEDREQRALLPATDPDNVPIGANLKRPEKSVLDHRHPHA